MAYIVDMLKNKKADTDIIISGAGVVGLTTALLLSQKGFGVTLIEKGDPNSKVPKHLKDGHTTALMTASLNVLKQTGVWEKLSTSTESLQVLRIFDPEKTDQKIFDFRAKEIGKHNFGYNVPQTILRPLLLNEVKKSKHIEYQPNTIIEDISFGYSKVSVKTSDDNNYEAKLLIACDGRHSSTRQLLNIDIDAKEYDQTALTFTCNHRLPHENISTEIYKAGGPLTFVPLPGGKTSSVVWVNNKDKAERLLSMKKQELETALQSESKDILGDLKISSDISSWPLSTLRAKSFYHKRAALIGETAHGLSPVGAQGLNLSIRDIDALVHLIHSYAMTGQDIGSETLLNQYEKQRKSDVFMRYYGVDFLNQLIKSEDYFSKKVRELGLETISNILPLKHFLIRQGMKAEVKKLA